MKASFRNLVALSLIPQLLFLRWASLRPGWVEEYYSEGLYPQVSSLLRILYGWIPFSVGDLLYALLLISGCYYAFRGLRKLRTQPLGVLRNFLVVLSVAHFSFYFLWGMNYLREPLAMELEIDPNYTREELRAFTAQLVKDANRQQLLLAGYKDSLVHFPYSRQGVTTMSITGYRSLEDSLGQFPYRHPSLKPSLFSTLLSYMGYGGYLNPFTNEAQVNARVPLFRYAVICGHEIGHQLGYSAENETNFIGYLVASKHPDPYFNYAATAYALAYTLGALQRADPSGFEQMKELMHPGLVANYQELENFWKSFANPAEPVFKMIFHNFLKANRQKEGIRSYNRVVGLMIGYHRKAGYGKSLE